MTDQVLSPDRTSAEEAAMNDSPATRTDLQLEREKIEIERERLALERERLMAEREKWHHESQWKYKAEGRIGLSVSSVAVIILVCALLGVGAGVWLTERRSFRRDDMARMIAHAMHTSTNIQEQAQGKFLLKALSAPTRPSGGPYLILID